VPRYCIRERVHSTEPKNIVCLVLTNGASYSSTLLNVRYQEISYKDQCLGELKGLLPSKEFLHNGEREFNGSAWALASDQVAINYNSVLALALVRKFAPHSRVGCGHLSLMSKL
jgi:hypothetical protein